MTNNVNIELSSEELRVEPGGTVQLTVCIKNPGTEPDRFQVEIEGIDMEWYAIPVPAFTVESGEEKKERILFKPPRTSESRSGVYPFIVRVRSLETGSTSIAQGTLIIPAFHLLTTELLPKRGTASFFRSTVEYELTLSNLGNTELTLQLFASDPEDVCIFEFESERVVIPAGGQTTMLMHVQPGRSSVIGPTRLFGFTVTARAVDNAYISSSTQGQIERKAVTSPATLIMLLVILAGAFVWYATRPVPVIIDSLAVDNAQIFEGDKATLSWSVQNARNISLSTKDGQPIATSLPAQGQLPVTPKGSTTYVLTASNRLGQMLKEVPITVLKQPIPPPPRVISFTSDRKDLIKGESAQLSWKVLNAEKIYLSPLADPAPIPLEVSSRLVTPDRTTEYVLTVVNVKQTVSSKVTITVTEKSKSTIDIFTATPGTVDPGGTVTLTWRATGASKVDIDHGIGEVDYQAGTVDVKPMKTTKYQITATDNEGHTATQSITVVVKQPPVDPTGTETVMPSDPNGINGPR